ncbi:HET domain protein [Tricladium varicosporioides]|nr:HET domain protein [Hymenoscyphus varicosporioides]
MSLCTICETLDVSTKEDAQLGNYDDIAKRAGSGCELCTFFVDTLKVSSRWSHRIDKLSEKCIVLTDLSLQVRDPTLISRSSYSSNDLKFDVCVGDSYLDSSSPEIGPIRVIPADPRDERCFEQLRSWISECSEHENCSTSTPVSLPKCIIEVPEDPNIKPKLILSGDKKGSYLALAYFAGDEETSAMSRPMLGDDIDAQVLPRTFADAIEITHRLGFRYLFISSLCIPQDEWIKESSNFAHIYGNSTLLLSATTSTSSSSGILTQDRSKFYSPPVGPHKNQHLRQNLLRWRAEVAGSILTRDGWAVQSRILAPRVVHFTERQMIWECANDFSFEAGGVEDKSWGSLQVRQTYRKEFVQRYITEGLRRLGVGGEKITHSENNLNTVAERAKRFEAWYTMVDRLSQTSTSTSKDKILLLAPLVKLFDDGSLGNYLSGIWSKDIGIGLAWSRVYDMLSPASTYQAPSWSPLSIDGEISTLFMSWSPTILQDQAADPTWITKYGPKLISTHLVPSDPEVSYIGIKEGSHIVVEGACIAFKTFMNYLSDEKLGGQRFFRANPVLDTSWIFDCACCSNLNVSDKDRADKNEEFNQGIDKYVLMIAHGDGWRTDKSPVDMLILHEDLIEEGQGKFRRVGMMRMELGMMGMSPWKREDGSYDAEVVNKGFEGFGWERKVLRLF